jgi:hypothetical protein
MKNLLLILLPFQLLFSQEKVDVQKMFDIAMDSIIMKNPKDYYYLSKKDILTSSKIRLENPQNCNYDYSSFSSQVRLEENNLNFHYKNKIINKNIISKLLYGKHLKSLTIFSPWENKMNEFVLILIITDKKGGDEYRITFNDKNYNVLGICILPFIF